MRRSLILLLLGLGLCFELTSCGVFGGNKGDEPVVFTKDDKPKKKKKVKRCKEEACHIRMNHYHQGAEFKGKRGGFFTRLFAPKQPKYGEGLPRNSHKRDPAQKPPKQRK